MFNKSQTKYTCHSAYIIFSQVLSPAINVRDLAIWKSVYMSDIAPASPDESMQTSVHSPTETGKLTRTRSVDDIHTASAEDDSRRGSIGENPTMPRRLSDPNLSDLRLEGRIGTPSPNRKLSERSPESPTLEPKDVKSEESEQVAETEVSEDKTPVANGHSDMDSEPDHMENGEADLAKPLTNGHDDLLNGNCVDEEDFDPQSNDDSKNSMTSTPVKSCRTNSVHSVDDSKLDGSTDTLTGENSSAQQPGEGIPSVENHHNGHLCNGDAGGEVDIETPKGSRTNSRNGSCDEVDKEAVSGSLLLPNSRKLEHCTSISTSTSDISSSHIGMSEALCLESMRAPMFWSTNNLSNEARTRPQMPLHTKLANDPRSRNHSGGSSIPSFASAHSSPRPSPGYEGHPPLKFSAMPNHTPPQPSLPLSPSTLRLGRHLDEDGLTCVNMPQQSQLLELMQQHEQEMLMLHQKVQQMHNYLKQMQEQQAMGLALPIMNGDVNGEMVRLRDSCKCGLGSAGNLTTLHKSCDAKICMSCLCKILIKVTLYFG